MRREHRGDKHWTLDNFLEHMYGLNSRGDGHLETCAACRSQLEEMRKSRAVVEAQWNAEESVSFERLALQRRRIYSAIDVKRAWWSRVAQPRWASAALALTLLAGGATFVEQHHSHSASADRNNALSDAQLAEAVSSFADNSEPNAVAPIQELFED